MFVRVPRENNILRLPERFARLVEIQDNGDLVFEVRHFVRQSDIVKKNARLVRVSVATRVFQKIDVNQTFGSLSPSAAQLVKNVLRLVPDARNSIKNFENFIVSRKMVDNSIVLDNDLVSQLLNATDPKLVQGLYKSKLIVRSVRDLNSENANRPVLQVNNAVQDDQSSLRQMIQKNILQYGFDPSHVSTMVDDSSLTPYESTAGVSQKLGKLPDHLTTTQFFKRVTQPPRSTPSSTLEIGEEINVLTAESVFSDESEVRTLVTVPSDKIRDGAGNILPTFFKLELLNTGGVAVQTIQEPVDILRLYEAFFMPKTPPIVHFGYFDTTSKAVIKVKQLDPRAVGVKLFRKNFEYSSNNLGGYQFVAEYDLSAGAGFTAIPVDVSPMFTTIYRVVPVGRQNIVGSEFTNVVINPRKVIRRRKYVAMTTKVVSTGLNIDVTDVPVNVVSFKILRRDATIKDDFTVVGDSITQVTPENDAATYTVVDTQVKKGHVYEYVCELIFKNGDTFDAGRAFVEFYPLVENLVDTRIENVKVSHAIDNFDVTFDLTSIVGETNLDSVKRLLESQGLSELFNDDLFTERDKLQNLIAHNIDRVDLTDGVRETFGVFTEKTFSDSALRNINSVLPLKAGHKYRYEVSALLRAPETLFENFVKTVVDPSTKKEYTFHPAKFYHPITLTHGNITSTQTLAAHYPKSQFSFGTVGNLAAAEVSFANDSVYITESSASAFDRLTNVIKWSINGSPETIDHFLILKDSLGQRTVIGKSHAINDTTSFRFFHELSTSDVGEFVYIIVPVFANYVVGQEARTNTVKAE